MRQSKAADRGSGGWAGVGGCWLAANSRPPRPPNPGLINRSSLMEAAGGGSRRRRRRESVR